MKKSKYTAVVFACMAVLAVSGCSLGSGSSEAEPTSVPVTPTPTAAAVTVTPVPTSTPAPKVIGVKTSQSKYIYLTNNLTVKLREIYLADAGTEEWGKNLIPSESSVNASETVQMFYSDDSSSVTSTSEDGTTSSNLASFDLKITTADGNTYTIYSIALGDMEKGILVSDAETAEVYLRYMSLSENKEKDTRDNTVTSTDSEDDSEDDYDDSYDYDDEDYYDDSYYYDDEDYSGGNYYGADDQYADYGY